jgi:hypothetical protein
MDIDRIIYVYLRIISALNMTGLPNFAPESTSPFHVRILTVNLDSDFGPLGCAFITGFIILQDTYMTSSSYYNHKCHIADDFIYHKNFFFFSSSYYSSWRHE